ncbi:MAG: hypothetical protein LBC84_07470 [Prevotellaceae bacterium]|jgi:hypothetical protein|nr:hypothetical protein [Prevotellaceae bacterium]
MNPNNSFLIVMPQHQKELQQQFSRLQPHGQYQVDFAETAAAEDLKSPLPIIFVQPHTPHFSQVAEGETSLSINLISPGSSDPNDIAAQIIAHPHTANLSWIGYQSYLTPFQLLALMRARYFTPLRLGNYREKPTSAESLIRPNNLSFIDLSAVRHSDAPDGLTKEPNGLYAEEICQLAHYIGISSRPKTCYIYGYPQNIESSPITSQLIVQILWHLLESFSTNLYENPQDPNQQAFFSTREVYMGDHNHILFFLCSKQTGRLWIKIPSQEDGFSYLPCSQEEYATALNGELPAVWIHHYQKINLQ